MTYEELAKEIARMTKEQKMSDVVVYIDWEDEYIPVNDIWFSTQNEDRLDPEHPILRIEH